MVAKSVSGISLPKSTIYWFLRDVYSEQLEALQTYVANQLPT
jgi:hypothetical protein